MHILRWFVPILATLLGLLLVSMLLVWALSPFAVRHFAKQPLAELGVSLSDSSQLRYNPFLSTLHIADLQLLDAERQAVFSLPSGKVSFTLYKLLADELHISELTTKGGHIRLLKSERGVTIAGIKLPASQATQSAPAAEPATESTFSLSVHGVMLEDFSTEVNWHNQPHSLVLQSLKVRDLWFDPVQQRASVQLNVLLNQAPIRVSSELTLRNKQGEVTTDIALTQLAIGPLLDMAALPELAATGLVDVQLSPRVSVDQQGVQIVAEQVQLGLTGLQLAVGDWLYQSQQDAFRLSDVQLKLGQDAGLHSLVAGLEASMQQGQLALGRPDNLLASWQQLAFAPHIQLQDAQPAIKLPEFRVTGLQLSPQADATVANLPQLVIKDVSANQQAVAIGQISLDGGKVSLVLNEQGQLANLPNLAALQATSQPTENHPQMPDTRDRDKLALSLGGFTLDKPLEIALLDQQKGFSKQLSLDNLQLGSLNSQQPTLKTPVTLAAKDDGYLRIHAKGEAAVFSPKVNAVFDATVNELSLPTVSPYLSKALGFDMQSGELDLDLAMQIQDDQLDGEAKVKARGLETSSVEDEQGEQNIVGSGSAMSLNLALDTLKDSKGNIDLDVPVSGDLASPSFGFGSFLELILKKAAISQAKNYLIDAFVPYAAVVKIVWSGAETLLKVRLEPLVFDAQQTSWPEQGQTYVQQLAALLAEKPDIHVKLCAVSTLADLPEASGGSLEKEQRNQLSKLGEARELALKAALVEQGVASSRLLLCKPGIDQTADALPRIELKTN